MTTITNYTFSKINFASLCVFFKTKSFDLKKKKLIYQSEKGSFMWAKQIHNYRVTNLNIEIDLIWEQKQSKAKTFLKLNKLFSCRKARNCWQKKIKLEIFSYNIWEVIVDYTLTWIENIQFCLNSFTAVSRHILIREMKTSSIC